MIERVYANHREEYREAIIEQRLRIVRINQKVKKMKKIKPELMIKLDISKAIKRGNVIALEINLYKLNVVLIELNKTIKIDTLYKNESNELNQYQMRLRDLHTININLDSLYGRLLIDKQLRPIQLILNKSYSLFIHSSIIMQFIIQLYYNKYSFINIIQIVKEVSKLESINDIITQHDFKQLNEVNDFNELENQPKTIHSKKRVENKIQEILLFNEFKVNESDLFCHLPLKGIKIEFKGKFKNKQKRSQIIRGQIGKLPKNTLSAKLELSDYRLITKAGCCNIKVWINRKFSLESNDF